MAESDDTSHTTPDSDRDAFAHYWSYAKLWRTWVIGVAAGAVFVLVNKDVGGRFECRATIATLFLVAGGFQVLLAWINKIGAYYEYRYQKGDVLATDPRLRQRWARFWRGMTERFWLDVVCDLISLALVAWGLCIMVREVLP